LAQEKVCECFNADFYQALALMLCVGLLLRFSGSAAMTCHSAWALVRSFGAAASPMVGALWQYESEELEQ
jgi:hypothetical protein